MKNIKLPSGIVILDAPGINGMGGEMSKIRMSAYVEAGGPLLHPMKPSNEHLEQVQKAVMASNNTVEKALGKRI